MYIFFVSVPGLGGNQLEAKLHKPSVVHYICFQNTAAFYSIWLNPTQFIPEIIDCWVDNMVLSYDNVTRKTRNAPGVKIRIPGFGDPRVIEYIDPSFIGDYDDGAYFSALAQALLARGYERQKNLFGAPYDFRKGPSK